MSVTIHYRHPQRPDEAGVTVVSGRKEAAAIKDQLENRGYLVIEISTASFSKSLHQSD